MRVLRRCLHELWSLFVDDGYTACCTVGWIVAACLVLPRVPVGAWSGPILFAGIATIVAISARPKG